MKKHLRKITAFLLTLLMILSICLPNANRHGANDVYAAENGLSLENFHIRMKNLFLKDGDIIMNGQEMSLEFDWSITNTSKRKKFSADIYGEGITVCDYPKTVMYDAMERAVGTWWVEDKTFTIELNEAFMSKTNIVGGASLDFLITVQTPDGEYDTVTDLIVGDAVIRNVKVDLTMQESKLNLGKNKSRQTYMDSDGNLCQPYRVSISALYGPVTLKSVSDTPAGLELLEQSVITTEYPDGSMEEYDSWEALNTALQSFELQKSERITLDYVMKISDKKAALKEEETAVSNQFSVDYITNQKTEKTTTVSDEGIYLNKPSLRKTGQITEYGKNNEPKKVRWTVTLNPGILHSSREAETAMIANLKDAPGMYGKEDADCFSDGLTLDDFTYNESTGSYSLTYESLVNGFLMDIDNFHLSHGISATFQLDEEELVYRTPGVIGTDIEEAPEDIPQELLELKEKPSETYRNSIDYEIRINLNELNRKKTLSTEDTIHIEELLPDGMRLIDSSAQEKVICKWYDQWVEEPEWKTSSSGPWDWKLHTAKYSVADQKLNLDIQVTDATLDVLQSAGPTEQYILVISYSTQLDRAGAQNLYEYGKGVYPNKISVSLNGDESLDEKSDEVKLEASPVVKCFNTYDDKHYQSVPYTVYVNMDALELSPVEDTLKAENISGQDFILKPLSMKIYEYMGNGDPELDDSDASWQICQEASYLYDQAYRKISLTLPDNKALKIKYDMYINLYGGGVKCENDFLFVGGSYVQFILSDVDASKGTVSDEMLDSVHNQPVWASEQSGSMMIYSYRVENGNMVPYYGSEFELWKCRTDEEGHIHRDKLLKSGIQVDSQTAIAIVDGLEYDYDYVVYRKDKGSSRRSESHWFSLYDGPQKYGVFIPVKQENFTHNAYFYIQN